MKRLGRPPKTDHAYAARRRKFTITVLHDPTGDLTGLLMSAYEFAYGLVYGVWSDGTTFRREGKVYRLIGKYLYNAEGGIVRMQTWDPTGIIGQRWQSR
jgi:hypothetical protein